MITQATVKEIPTIMASDIFTSICFELEVTEQLVQLCLKDYEMIRACYVLEGNQLIWKACALYGILLSFSINDQSPNLENPVIGHLLSRNIHLDDFFDNKKSNFFLTKLLKRLQVSSFVFFSKFQSWMRMMDLPPNVTSLIDSITHGNNTSYLIFQKYRTIFGSIFSLPDKFTYVALRNNKRKTRKRLCDSNELFHFIWLLFVSLKEFKTVLFDLKNCYHLLVICVQFGFLNVVRGGKDMVFKLLSEDLLSQKEILDRIISVEENKTDPEVLFKWLLVDRLNYNLLEECLIYIRNEIFNPFIDYMNKDGVFSYNYTHEKGGLEANVLSENLKYFLFLYKKKRILHYGIDETEYPKILYPQMDEFLVLLPSKEFLRNSSNGLSLIRLIDNTSIQTPLSDLKMPRGNHPEKGSMLSPINYLLNLCSIMDQLIYEDGNDCFELFVEALKKYEMEALKEYIIKVYNKAFKKIMKEIPEDVEKGRLYKVKDFYFKCLYRSIGKEQDEEKVKYILQIFRTSNFQKSLLSVCFEIFIFINDKNNNNQTKMYPWICDILRIEYFYLIQCIEMVVKNEPMLPKILIKHLMILEEEILSYYGWFEESPIYSKIKDLVIDHNLYLKNNNVQNSVINDSTLPLYFNNVKISNYFDYETIIGNDLKEYEEFHNANYGDVNNEKKFVVNYTMPIAPVYQFKDLSLKMFYQKVYFLIYTRLNEFCKNMQLGRLEMVLTWCTIEYILVKHYYLMKRGHLDQIIICSLYSILKFLKKEVPFNFLFECYMKQPQARDSLYNNLDISKMTLLENNPDMTIIIECGLDSQLELALKWNKSTKIQNHVPGPNRFSSLLNFFSEEQQKLLKDYKGNILEFHLKIFQVVLKPFLRELFKSLTNGTLFVPPYPMFKSHSPFSPKKISENLPIYLSPMKKPRQLMTPTKNGKIIVPSSACFKYTKDSSPFIFQKINNHVIECKANWSASAVKRKLNLDHMQSPISPSIKRKLFTT